MTRRWAALAGAAVAVVCVAVGGTAGVMRAVAGDGENGSPPMERGGAPSAKVKQTPGTKLLGTWVHTGLGPTTLVAGGYTTLDSPITVICKIESCLLAVDKTVVATNGANASQLAPCVSADGVNGGDTCAWIGSQNGWPAAVNYGGGSTEIVSLARGTHTVQVKAYASAANVVIDSYSFVYRLYR
jgi:hypothetical protein